MSIDRGRARRDAGAPRAAARGADRRVAHDDRSQEDRRALLRHGVRVLPDRRRARGGDAGRARRAPAASSSDRQTYNALFTIHGIIMIFLFVAPFGLGLGELPRAAADRRAGHGVPAAERDVVLVLRRRRPARAVWASFATDAAAPRRGWTGYPPLSGPR